MNIVLVFNLTGIVLLFSSVFVLVPFFASFFQKGDDIRIVSFEISGDGIIEVSAGFDDVRIE